MNQHVWRELAQGTFKIENWRPDDRLLPPVLPGPDKMMFGVRISSGATNIIKYGVTFNVDRFKGMRIGRGRSRSARGVGPDPPQRALAPLASAANLPDVPATA